MMSEQEDVQTNHFFSSRANLKRLKESSLKLGSPRKLC